ncbi:GAP family protein [Microbacterium sp. NPDC058389]|uniref:GAP family protein n=1 Tax=Microbacterium sp. NPDC058389 TaxID=3346475 RepID=UPI00366262F0
MELWTTLVPLIVGAAVVPVQLTITVLLVRGPHGVRTASAWVAGRAGVMLVQGALFGFVFASPAVAGAESDDGTTPITSALLLVVAILFLAGALKQLLGHTDPDAAPPKWMSALDSFGSGRAFLLGAGLMLISAKFWVFTLTAVGAIADDQPGALEAAAIFLAYIMLSSATHLGIIVTVAAAPHRSAAVLDAVSGWLARHNRVLMIVIGLVFGIWFAIKALHGLGAF